MVEDFESGTDGDLVSGSGWSSPAGAARYSNLESAAGLISLRIPASTPPGEALRSVASSEWSGNPIAWVDLWVLPVASDDPAPWSTVDVDGASVYFLKDGSVGRVHALRLHATNPSVVEATGATFTLTPADEALVWQRVTMRHDLNAKRWDLFVNGTLRGIDYIMADPMVFPVSISLRGDTVSDVFFDDLRISAGNPLFTDTDNDGMPDSFEISNALNALVNDRAADRDNDGNSNLFEYLKGSEPDDYYSQPSGVVAPAIALAPTNSGNDHIGRPSQVSSVPFAAKVTAGGNALPNAPVIFTVTSGGGLLSNYVDGSAPSTSVTADADGSGIALAWLISPATPGTHNYISAAVPGQSVTFHALTLSPWVMSGVVAAYQFEESSGTTAYDQSGNGYNATLVNGVTRVPAWLGSGVKTGGGNEYIELPANSALNGLFSGSYSLAVRYTPAAMPSGTGDQNNAFHGLFMKTGYHSGLWELPSGAVYATHYHSASSNTTAIAASVMSVGVQRQLVMVVDRVADKIRIYSDGALVQENNFNEALGNYNFGATPLRIGIGAPDWNTYRWCANGKFDDAQVYARALTTQEITDMNRGGEDTDSDLIPDWYEWKAIDASLNDGLVGLSGIGGSQGGQPRNFDNDGLSDNEEWTRRTDPVLADTDGDGMPDGYEVTYGFDPLSALDGSVRTLAFSAANMQSYAPGSQDMTPTGYSFPDGTNEVHLSGNTWKAFTPDAVIFVRPGTMMRYKLRSDAQKSELLATGLDVNLAWPTQRTISHFGSEEEGDILAMNYAPSQWKRYSVYPHAGSDYTSTYFVFACDADASSDGDLRVREFQWGEDSDNDGLFNTEEFQRGTNPTSVDSDGDGMPDGWEVEHGSEPNPNVPGAVDAKGDADHDGVLNIQEYKLGRHLAAHWNFQYLGVTGAEDVTGNANWAAASNGPVITAAGRVGAGVYQSPLTTSQTRGFSVSPTRGVKWPHRFTISGWFKPERQFSQMAFAYPTLLHCEEYSTAKGFVSSSMSANSNTIGSRVGNAGISPVATYSETSSGQWIHIATTYDRGTLRVYKNGTQVASFASSVPVNPVSDALGISIGLGFEGTYDELRLYHEALPLDAIQALCATETDSDRDGLDAYQEQQFGTLDSDIDSDNDGWSDKGEVLAGTDPKWYRRIAPRGRGMDGGSRSRRNERTKLFRLHEREWNR